MIALVLAWSMAAQCSGAACPNPCTECVFTPAAGTNGTAAELRQQFATIAERQGGTDLPAIADVESGASREPWPAPFPCRLLPAIAATESTILQFCEESGLTVISFDCGFGIMQVTTDALSYPGLESRADINIAAGADLLAGKWNADEVFGGHFGDSDPALVESWYFAVWAYNGFVYSNNPNNPSLPANRPPFRSPSSLSRGSYPYQELVWGFLEFPLEKDGAPMWQSLPVTHPERSSIPDQSGLFDVAVPLPEPAHADPCVEECPPEGCPPPELRSLFFDELDPSFTLTGTSAAVDVDALTDEHAEGGFRDRFLSVPNAPAGSPTLIARWEGTAPSSGVFDVAAFIPLDPATSEDVRVTVDALGHTSTFSMSQNVEGGLFSPLGQVVLEAGQGVVVTVANDTSDTSPDHRLGLDAFRFTWRGGVEEPGTGEGEGKGEEPVRLPTVLGCACRSSRSAPLDGLLVAGLLAGLVLVPVLRARARARARARLPNGRA